MSSVSSVSPLSSSPSSARSSSSAPSSTTQSAASSSASVLTSASTSASAQSAPTGSSLATDSASTSPVSSSSALSSSPPSSVSSLSSYSSSAPLQSSLSSQQQSSSSAQSAPPVSSSSSPMTLSSAVSTSIAVPPSVQLLCAVSPLNGTAFLTVFTLSCAGALVGGSNTSALITSNTFAYAQVNESTSVSLSSAQTLLPIGTFHLIALAIVPSLNASQIVQQTFATVTVTLPALTVATVGTSSNSSNSSDSAVAAAAAAVAAACVLQDCIANALSPTAIASQSVDQTLALVSSLASAAATQSAVSAICPNNATTANTNSSTGNTTLTSAAVNGSSSGSSSSSSSVSDTLLSIIASALSSSSPQNPLSVTSLATISSTLAVISDALISPTVPPTANSSSETIETIIAVTSTVIANLESAAAAAGVGGYYALVSANTSAAATNGQTLLNSIASTVSNLLATVSSSLNQTSTAPLTAAQCNVLSASTSLVDQLLAAGLDGATNSSSLAFNEAAFNASSTRLSGADETVATAANINVTVPSSALTASAGGGLDLRVVSVGSQWSTCLVNSTTASLTGSSASPIYSIDLTTANGTAVNTTNISPPLQFSFPASFTSSQAQTNANSANCQSDGQVHSLSPVCSFFDTTTQSWSSVGCSLGSVDTAGNVMCYCTHLTEFTLLYAESVYPCSTLSQSGYLGYIAVAIVYVAAGLFALTQLIKMRLYSPSWMAMMMGHTQGPPPTLLLLQHTIIGVIALCRFAAALIDFVQMSTSVAVGGVIALVPYVGSTVVFSLTVMQWMIIYYHTAAKQNVSVSIDPLLLTRLRYRLLASNATVAVLVCVIYIGIFATSNSTLQADLAALGIVVCSIFVAILALCFAVFGTLLVRSLTTDFSSRYATRLLLQALTFSAVLFSQSILQLYLVLDVSSVAANDYDMFNVAYYCLDVCGLFLVMIMFNKSVTDYTHTQLSKSSRSSQVPKSLNDPVLIPTLMLRSAKKSTSTSVNSIQMGLFTARSQSQQLTDGAAAVLSSPRPASSSHPVSRDHSDSDDSSSAITPVHVRTSSNAAPVSPQERELYNNNALRETDLMDIDEMSALNVVPVRTARLNPPAPAAVSAVRDRRSSWVMIKQTIQSVTDRLQLTNAPNTHDRSGRYNERQVAANINRDDSRTIQRSRTLAHAAHINNSDETAFNRQMTSTKSTPQTARSYQIVRTSDGSTTSRSGYPAVPTAYTSQPAPQQQQPSLDRQRTITYNAASKPNSGFATSRSPLERSVTVMRERM